MEERDATTRNLAWLAGVLLCQLLAFWDSWSWLARRAAQAAGDMAGLLAVVAVTACLVVFSVMSKRRIVRFSLVPQVVLLLIYGASYWLWPTPPIFKAAIAMLCVFLTLHRGVFGRRPPPAYWGMVLCALPVVPSLQFYLGYPARLISAGLTVPLLRMNGLSVHREGTYLVWQDQQIQFDAPCSGITMLWAGVLLTFTLAYLRNFTGLETLRALGVCAVLVLFGNVLRAGSLFYLETGIVTPAAPWWHEGVGVAVFIGIAAVLVAVLNRWKTCSPV
ncbi:archaeosortase/exosortase family protein [Exilibacterium tricleocarpae]|nr:archaeosortase/exosortase family protein [Exilibacterium tricleocarpae]